MQVVRLYTASVLPGPYLFALSLGLHVHLALSCDLWLDSVVA